MFRFPARLLFAFFSNIIALAAAVYLIKGFVIAPDFAVDPTPFLMLAAILAVLQVLVRPFVKLFLGPFIVLTFGLMLFVINMGMLWFLDFLSPHITIQGLQPLFFATIIIGIVNIMMWFAARRIK